MPSPSDNNHDKRPATGQDDAAEKTGPTRRAVLGFTLISGGVLGAAGYFLWPAIRQSSVFLEPAERSVNISMSGFSPKRISAKVGQEIKLRLINKDNSLHTDGGGWHQFAIDELDIDFQVAPLTVSDLSFTVDRPGTYDFYCGICCGGKANPYMYGQLTVEA
ncbi:MAG: cupredoxin domain-containing protein [Paracoccaceae bacterium]